MGFLLEILIYLFIIIYNLVIFSILYGWNKIEDFSSSKRQILTKVSVIIAVRNEAENIRNIIDDLKIQLLDKIYFEVLFIDDSSTDNTTQIIKEEIIDFENFRLLNLNPDFSGKKNAIKYGIENSKNHLIVTTDADCRVQKEWLCTIIDYYEKYHPKMIVAPVMFEQTIKKFSFANLQSIEFLSLIVSGAGAIGIGKPILCNGANLAFEKNIIAELRNPMNEEHASGDDVFLLLNLKKKFPESVKFLKSKKAIVFTKPQSNLKDFINQRIRWTSKSKYYFDFDIIFVSVVVFLSNLSILIALISSIFDLHNLIFFLMLFILKLLPDFVILKRASEYFEIKNFNILFFPTQFLYIWYVVFIAIFGNLLKFSWKNRKY